MYTTLARRTIRDDLAVQTGAVADEDVGSDAGRQPARQRRMRIADGRRVDLDEPAECVACRRRHAIQRAEHVAAMRVHPCATTAPAATRSAATCASASSADTATIRFRARTPAPDRRDADAQAGERSRAGRHREQVDVRRRRARALGEDGEQIRRQPLGVRPRRIAARSATTRSSSTTATLPRARRRVQSQHTHAIDYRICQRRRRRRCVSISTPSSSIATRSCSSGWATSTRCSTRTPSSPRARSS